MYLDTAQRAARQVTRREDYTLPVQVSNSSEADTEKKRGKLLQRTSQPMMGRMRNKAAHLVGKLVI